MTSVQEMIDRATETGEPVDVQKVIERVSDVVNKAAADGVVTKDTALCIPLFLEALSVLGEIRDELRLHNEGVPKP